MSMNPGAVIVTIDLVKTIPRRQWWTPAGLILLGLVPVIVGTLRVTELASNPAVTAENARFIASPVPIFLHVIGGVVYAVLGAFQFVPGLRQHRRRWHRISGRLLIPCGLALAGAGVWMAIVNDPPVADHPALTVFRLFFGSLMIVSLVLGYANIRRRDIATHRAWMMRAYAIAIAAGTQTFVFLGWIAVAGEPDAFTESMLFGAGWVINLAFVEWRLRKPAGDSSVRPELSLSRR